MDARSTFMTSLGRSNNDSNDLKEDALDSSHLYHVYTCLITIGD